MKTIDKICKVLYIHPFGDFLLIGGMICGGMMFLITLTFIAGNIKTTGITTSSQTQLLIPLFFLGIGGFSYYLFNRVTYIYGDFLSIGPNVEKMLKDLDEDNRRRAKEKM